MKNVKNHLKLIFPSLSENEALARLAVSGFFQQQQTFVIVKRHPSGRLLYTGFHTGSRHPDDVAVGDGKCRLCRLPDNNQALLLRQLYF